jgi:hypothetical protein
VQGCTPRQFTSLIVAISPGEREMSKNPYANTLCDHEYKKREERPIETIRFRGSLTPVDTIGVQEKLMKIRYTPLKCLCGWMELRKYNEDHWQAAVAADIQCPTTVEPMAANAGHRSGPACPPR